MSSSISSAASNPFVFSGTQTEAKTEVKKLRNILISRRDQPGSSNPEFILLKKIGEGGRTPHFFFHGLDQNSISRDIRMQTAGYVKSLIKKAYPEDSSAGYSLETAMIHEGFASYLKGNVENEGALKPEQQSSTHELLSYLQELHLVVLEQEIQTHRATAGEHPFIYDEVEQIAPIVSIADLIQFLNKKGVELKLTDFLGEGAFGQVFGATIEGKEDQYAYKTEVTLRDLNGHGSPFWRQGDSAASQISSLSNRARSLFFIVSVESTTSTQAIQEKFYFVPAAQAKIFGMKQPEGSKMILRGQLMERAEGKDLSKLLEKKPISLHPTSPHFRNVVTGLFKVLQEMQVHHLAHNDIKLENVVYDPTTEKVTLLDFGSAERLRKKDKIDDGSHRHSPSSSKLAGTLHYMSPRVLQKQPHGAEVDFFSFAMVVLALVSKKELEQFGRLRFPDMDKGNRNDDVLKNGDPKKYLDRYLQTIGHEPITQSQSLPSSLSGAKPASWTSWMSGSSDTERPRTLSEKDGNTAPVLRRVFSNSSTTGRALTRYPEIGTIIDLAFQASAGGEEGLAAAQKLSQLPYLLQNTKVSELTAVTTEA